MIRKITKAGLVLATLAVTLMMSIPADAQSRRKSPPVNYSYMEGPRTRVYITRRSWLDMGTEVKPGDRKYTDYAFPPGQSSYYSDIPPYGLGGPRQPLNSPLDMGGYPSRIPF